MASFDGFYIFPYNQGMIDRTLRISLRNALMECSFPARGWIYRSWWHFHNRYIEH
jgi:hypothetical protein